MDKILSVHNLNTFYEDTQVLKDISFSLYKKEILVIVGESGGGKSTLLKSIIGGATNNKVSMQGEIRLHEKSMVLKEAEMQKIRGREIGIIPQNAEASLSPLYKIGEQFYDILRAHENVTRKEALKRSAEVLERLNLDANMILNSYSFMLSGGMNQRVMIAMALVLKPSVVLCDEPTSNIDIVTQKAFIKYLLKMRKEIQMSILFVTHDLKVASAIADRIMVLKDGQIIECNSVEAIFNHPKQTYTKELVEGIYE